MKAGEKYGMLTLIKIVPKPVENKRNGKYWLCQCDCGNECIKHYYDIQCGDTKSCGCLKKRQPLYDKNEVVISNKSGIYGFQNIYNGKWYIGKSKNLYNRYMKHKSESKRILNKQFYQAINKYGWGNFNYYILEEYDEIPDNKFLSEREEYYIKKYDSYVNGYNASEISSGGFYSKEHQGKCTEVLKNLNEKQKGENHPRTTFTKEEILEIFDYGLKGAPAKIVYDIYKDKHDITYESFKQIYRGEHFIEYLPINYSKRPVVSTNSKLWGYQVIDIKTRFKNGETLENVYNDYKHLVSKKIIRDIYNKKTYKNIQPCID